MSAGLVVRGGTVVSPIGQRQLDLRCRDGRIVELGVDLEPDGEEVLDAHAALVLPGVVDPHVHFALEAAPHRTADDFASGSASGLAGGVTTFIDFAHQHAGESFEQAIDARLAEAAAGETPILRPIFEPGDALLFDHLFLHRTGTDPGMTETRYATETWFFAPSAYPDATEQVPLVF